MFNTKLRKYIDEELRYYRSNHYELMGRVSKLESIISQITDKIPAVPEKYTIKKVTGGRRNLYGRTGY